MLDMQILQLGWMTVTYSLADTVLTNCLVQLLEVNNKSAAFCLIAPMAFSAKVDAIRRIITTAAVPLPVESPAADVLLKKLDTLNKAVARRNVVVHSQLNPSFDAIGDPVLWTCPHF